jgi:hypothetical protein
LVLLLGLFSLCFRLRALYGRAKIQKKPRKCRKNGIFQGKIPGAPGGGGNLANSGKKFMPTPYSFCG